MTVATRNSVRSKDENKTISNQQSEWHVFPICILASLFQLKPDAALVVKKRFKMAKRQHLYQ
jgi:hypothetical protein